MLETSFALSIVNERYTRKKLPLSLPPLGGGGDVTGREGGHNREVCVHERVQCHVHVFFSSVTVSQCHREGVQGGGGLQLVNGVQGGLQSTVEVEVYSSLGNSLYCRLSGGLQ